MQTKFEVVVIDQKLSEYVNSHAGETLYAVGIAHELSMTNKDVYDQLTALEKLSLIEISWDELVMQVTFLPQQSKL